MIRKYILPLVAVVGAIFAVIIVRAGNKPVPAAPPVAQPAASPFAHYIAGAGILEARTENVAIGTGEGGTVIGVFVKVGDRVTEGQKLFQLRNFTQTAEAAQAKGKIVEADAGVAQALAAVVRAQADLQRLVEYPRKEDVKPVAARAKEAEAALADAKAQLELWQSIADKDKRAVSEDDLIRRKFAVLTSQAKYDAARADLDLLTAGTWVRDIDVAKAKVEEASAALKAAQAAVVSAKAASDAAEARLERLTIKSPMDGRVLQVKIRKGEYASAAALSTPLMVLGDDDTLVVRTDVDENDAWRFKDGSAAVAFVRGNRDQRVTLTFDRVEPYVVPKRSLTGESTERVDTRVLQVLYRFPRKDLPNVYVGQQMDVYVEAQPVGGDTTKPAATAPK
ncbi:MAG: HlyD family secretion protein [Phycisphaerae bacterium]